MRGTMRRLIVVVAAGRDDGVRRRRVRQQQQQQLVEQHAGVEHVGGRAGAAGQGQAPVTIGTKDFTEEFILGELYKRRPEAKGYTVNLKKNIGATEIIDTALTSHKIDAYPEYTGESVATVAKRNEPAKSADEEYQLAKKFYEGRGQTVSEPTPF